MVVTCGGGGGCGSGVFVHENENLLLFYPNPELSLFHAWSQGVEVAAELADFLKEDVPRLFGKVMGGSNHEALPFEIVMFLVMIYIINRDDTCILACIFFPFVIHYRKLLMIWKLPSFRAPTTFSTPST